MQFKDRLKKARKNAGFTQTQVAESIEGLTQPSYSALERGDSKRTSKIVELATLFNVNPTWLSNGTGEMISKKSPLSNNDNILRVIHYGGDDVSELQNIPYYDAKVACGHGFVNNETPDILGYYQISSRFLASMGLSPIGDGVLIVQSSGDSMYPTIPTNTPILVNTKEKEYNQLLNNKIYVFNVKGEMICKRITLNLDGSITIKSDNTDKKNHADITVKNEDLVDYEIFGRVKMSFNEF